MKFCINCMAKIRDTKDVCPFCGQFQEEGVKSSFHLSPGITLNGGRYLVGKAVKWDDFSIMYVGRDLMGDAVVSIQEYMPETIVRRQTGNAGVSCISQDVVEKYQKGLQCFVETAELMREQGELLVNTIQVLNCFFENGTGYIITEYLNGQRVQQLLENGHVFTWDSAKQVVDAVLESIISLHQIGIYHQDIYPGCIFLTADGQIKLGEPGGYRYCLIGDKIQRSSVVRNGYSAEELYRNKGEIVPCTDVYGIGAVMFHMMTGKKPLSAAKRVQEDTLQIPKEIQGTIPQNIQNAMMNSLQVLASDRTETPRKFQRELSEKKVEKIVAKADKNKNSGKKTGAVIAAAIIGLCILGGSGAGAVLRNGRAEKEIIAAQENLTPNLCGLSEEKAQEEAEKVGLKVEGTDVIPSEQPLGYVVSQEPQVNQEVEKGTVIKLTLSGGNEQVMVSDLTGRDKNEALKELKRKNLKVEENGIYTSGEKSTAVKKNQVLAVCVNGEELKGTSKIIEQNSEVILRVSLGDYETEVPELSVPDLSGKSKEEAEDLLNNQNPGGAVFRLSVIGEEYSTKVAKGSIIRQNTVNEALRPCDENGVPREIGVTLSMGPKMVSMPDVVKKTKDEAKKSLEDLNLQVSTTNVYSSTVRNGAVVSQSVAAGDEVAEGTVINLKISIGSEPVQNTPPYSAPSTSKPKSTNKKNNVDDDGFENES